MLCYVLAVLGSFLALELFFVIGPELVVAYLWNLLKNESGDQSQLQTWRPNGTLVEPHQIHQRNIISP